MMEKILLDNYSPPSVVVDNTGTIHYIHGKVGEFLDFPEGEAKMNIHAMVKKGLKLKVSAAIREVIKGNTKIHYENLPLSLNGKNKMHFNLSCIPVGEPQSMSGLIIVSFEKVIAEEKKAKAIELKNDSNKSNNIKLIELEEELHSTRLHLQTTIEELEVTNEELQSTNEELQSSNEELQSTNEELQTSKEELQSVNEELTTVNNELESKITELRKVNDDMNNLMVSSKTATLFLDNDLLIKRFTPACKTMLNLIDKDVGRSIKHISTNLLYDNMITDAEEVLKTLVPKDVDVQIQNSGWFNMRIVPYRTINNEIKGAVITFFNITERYIAEREKVKSLLFLDSMVETTRTPLVVLDNNLKIVRTNKAFLSMFNTTSEKTTGKYFQDLGNRQWNIPQLNDLLEKVASRHSSFFDYQVEHAFEKLGTRIMILNASELKIDEENAMILLSIEDITFQKNYERDLIESKTKTEDALNRATFFKDLLTHDVNNILQVLLASSEMISKFYDVSNGLEKIKELNSINLEQLIKAKILVHNIQVISKLDEEKKNIHPLEIVGIVKNAIIDLKNAYKEKNIVTNIQSVNEKESVMADELIKDAIENVLLNAVKHNDKENIAITVQISREKADSASYVKLEFIDNGPGIDDDKKTDIFEKKTRESLKGLGIGLSIVKNIIERYDGKIFVKNREKNNHKKGCNFVMLIPQVI